LDLFSRVEVQGECLIWTGPVDPDGYGMVSYKDETWRVPRLVWTFLCGPPRKGVMVLHSCDNPPCIRPDHLAPGSVMDNKQDQLRRGRQPRGSAHGRAKINEAQVVEIRQLHRERGMIPRELGEMYGVSTAAVEFIVKRQTWRHVP